MDENEQEFIEDFGAKSEPADAGGVPPALQKRPATAKRQGTARTNTKRGNGSPSKSAYGQTSRIGGDMNYDQYIAPADDSNAQGGSGEELAQTREKVVSQLDIRARTLHVLEQRVSMNE